MPKPILKCCDKQQLGKPYKMGKEDRCRCENCGRVFTAKLTNAIAWVPIDKIK